VARLEDKVAIITGAASGIGLAGAEAFVRAGARVVLVDVDDPALSLAAKRLDAEGDRAVAAVGDVRDEQSVAAAFDLAFERFGGLDIVWNNAGVESFGPVVAASDEDYRRVFDVNVLGVLHGTKLGLARLPEGGAIIQTASVAGLSGVAMQVLYAASKAAVVSITKTAALEGGARRIRCNAICPAVVDTPLVEKTLGFALTADMREKLASPTAMKRLVEPEEVAAAAVFLASDEASFVSGLAMTVDGAMTAGPQLQL
jgi:meso-butanediol dehydrogenase / (S,S)-butanediol dehydrogenase / diacetyl reductase